MEDGTRFGDSNGVVVKSRNSSGCLIIRKKNSDGVGSSGTMLDYDSRKEKKRLRLFGSDPGLINDQLDVYSKRALPQNGHGYDQDIVEMSDEGARKWNSSLEYVRVGNDGDKSARNTSRVECDEYGAINEKKLKGFMHERNYEVAGKSLLVSKGVEGNGYMRESEHGLSKCDNVYKRKHSDFDRSRDYMNNRFEMERDGTRVPVSFLREKFDDTFEKPIRIQGKNGVLKLMPNKKKTGNGLLKTYDQREADLMSKDTFRRDELVRPFYQEHKVHNNTGSSFKTEQPRLNLQRSSATKNSKALGWESENSDTSLKLGKNKINLQKSSATHSKGLDLESDNIDTSLKLGKAKLNLQKSLAIKKNMDFESDNSDTSLTLIPRKLEESKPAKLLTSKGDLTSPTENIPVIGSNGVIIKRSTGTEKQKLREQIKKMLLDAGWKIDYKPRRNRVYQDAVYVNPSGTAFWSIIKAYEALQKQFDEDGCLRPSGECSSFSPISDHLLNKLTRQTKKKIEKEMKRKQRDANGAMNAFEPDFKKSTKYKYDTVNRGSDQAGRKLSSFMKQRDKSCKGRENKNVFNDLNMECRNEAMITNEDNKNDDFSFNGKKSRNNGRSTLVLRGQNSEIDESTPFIGKRSLLSWLIDSGMVRLNEKVQYMNRKQTRVMQEGWITSDGIHCGCCSKILTVTKFEIHSGSKLCQPFQNIYLESGISLLQCLIDAWNKQEESERNSFHSVCTDGDDPNDDACGICGDGGDLICCDGCPSTYHQTCIGIQRLPTGDWHCPNCTCKICGIAGSSDAQRDEVTGCVLPTCSLCERKYHKTCAQDIDALLVDSTSPSFCGKKCKEMFENLQKFVGVKHDLDGWFSWSLIHRADITDSGSSVRDLAQLVEGNSKIAVALTVMNECFLPIVDRKSGINLIRNVLYNCGSNFNRLNCSGFYTAILERGDEIVSAASIRFHGTELAEMPFIGTRHIYRYQGMCKRLFQAIESALCAFKVEKVITPSISELRDSWTEASGFNFLNESQKEELRSMNMLVFPGIKMLQKILMVDENNYRNVTTGTGANPMEVEAKLFLSDTLNDVSVPRISLDAPHEANKVPLSCNELLCLNSQPDEKVPESKCSFPCDASSVVREREDNSIVNPMGVSNDTGNTNSIKPVSQIFEKVSPQHKSGYVIENKDDGAVSPLVDGNIKSLANMDASNGSNNLNSVQPTSHSFEKVSAQNASGEIDENNDTVDVSSAADVDTNSFENMDVSNGINNLNSIKPVSHSFGKESAQNVSGGNDENTDDVAGSSLPDNSENIMQSNSDLNSQNPCGSEDKSFKSNKTVVDSACDLSETPKCEIKIVAQLRNNLSKPVSDLGTGLLEIKPRILSGDGSAEKAPGFATSPAGDIQTSLEANNGSASVPYVEPVLHLSAEICALNSAEDICEENKASTFSTTSHGVPEIFTEF